MKRKEMVKIVPRHIDDRQISALKYLIAHSFDASNLVKRICFLMINQSENLTYPVSVFTSHRFKEIFRGIHDMISCMGKTFLNEVMIATGSQLFFSAAIKHNINVCGDSGVSVCLSVNYYGHEYGLFGHDPWPIKVIPFNLDEIDSIRLVESGLYLQEKDREELKERFPVWLLNKRIRPFRIILGRFFKLFFWIMV